MLNDEKILQHFPDFDYRQPLESWRVDATQKNSLAGLQIEAFHYYWTLQASKNGKIGLSLVTPDLPFCCTLSHFDHPAVHCREQIGNASHIFQPRIFSCVVVSAPLPSLPCAGCAPTSDKTERKRAQCQGSEVIPYLQQWAGLLMPDGLLMGALFDNSAALIFRNTNLIDELDFQHAWSAQSFRLKVMEPFLLMDQTLELIEYDTFRNNLAFNFVVRRK